MSVDSLLGAFPGQEAIACRWFQGLWTLEHITDNAVGLERVSPRFLNCTGRQTTSGHAECSLATPHMVWATYCWSESPFATCRSVWRRESRTPGS